jgi:hypothetical protein
VTLLERGGLAVIGLAVIGLAGVLALALTPDGPATLSTVEGRSLGGGRRLCPGLGDQERPRLF